MKNFTPKKTSFFRKTLAIACAGLFASSAFALSPLPYPLWTVEDGKLLDPNGNPFIFRGVTIDHSLAPEKTLQALRDIAALGANSAQIEFPIKPSGSVPFPRPIVNELREIVKACKDNKLVCVLEANDTAGYFEVEGGLGPDVVADYWGYYDIREVLNGAQGHIIIAISNQPLAPIFGAENYIDRMRYAISIIKNAYPLFAVMVDGSNWGQDTNKAMHTLAAQNLQSTSVYQDVIYSVEMFDQYLNPEKVRDYIASFSEIGAPLVIGGFGPVPYYHPHFNGPLPLNAPRLPAEAVMQYAEQYGAGYFGWSWSGNKNPALDVVIDWNPDHLTSWGNILFNDINGIKATAKPASIYVNSSSSSSVSSSSAPANQPPVAMFDVYNSYSGSCSNGRITATATGTYDPDGDDLTYSWSLSGSGGSATGYSASFTSRSGDRYQLTLTVTDSKGASVSLTKSVSPIYIDCSSSSTSSVRSSVTSSSADIVSSRSSTSSSSITPSSMSSSSRSSISSSRSSSSSHQISSASSSVISLSNCSYVIQSQWNNGFTAAIRIKNNGAQPISGWNVNWQYGDGSKITNLWNASLTGSNPYSAKNLSWNSTIQPGQTIEFGFQGSKTNGAATVPAVTGSICQ